MRAVTGHLRGGALKSRFAGVALEYLAARNKLEWVYVPHIIALRVPGDEKFLFEAKDAEERRFHRRNLIIELRERIPEVLESLQYRPYEVLTDTIQRLGLREHFYQIGCQVRPEQIQQLERASGMDGCVFREVGLHDMPQVMRLKVAA